MAELKLKQSMTSIDIAVAVKELKNLESCLVRAVFMPTRDTLVLELGCGDEMKYLVAEAGRRLHSSRSVFTFESVRTVKPFKKFLEGSKLVEVSQLDLERVATLKLRRGSKIYALYVELLPRGVLALVDEQGKVIAVNKKLSAKDRTVFAGSKYVPPPSPPDFMRLDYSGLAEAASKFEGSVVQFFIRSLGVPPEIVNEVLGEEERSTKLQQLGAVKLASLLERVRRFVRGVVGQPRPCVVLVSENPIAFFPFKPSRLPEDSEVVEYGSMNELLDEYFMRAEEASLRLTEVSRVRNIEMAVEKTLREAEENLSRISNRLSEVTKTIQLVERYYYEIETAWACCRKVVKEKGWASVVECGNVVGDPVRGAIRIRLPDGEVELLLYKDVNQQYADLRREYEHFSDKLARARETVRDLGAKLEEIATRRAVLESLRIRPRRTSWFSRFLWIETSGGFLAIGGRDASQNELLVRRYLGPRDIFMHADILGASAFVILTQGRLVPEEDLREVACLAASYSKAWKAGLSSVDVFWVWGEQVKLSAPPGEYLPKGSFMVYGQKNFIKNVELSLSLGVAYIGEYFDLVLGPLNLVESISVASVTVVPGDISVDAAAKEIREHFLRRCPDVRGLAVNDVAKLLPGKVKIVNKK